MSGRMVGGMKARRSVGLAFWWRTTPLLAAGATAATLVAGCGAGLEAGEPTVLPTATASARIEVLRPDPAPAPTATLVPVDPGVRAPVPTLPSTTLAPAPTGTGHAPPPTVPAPTHGIAPTAPPSEGCGEIGGLPGCVTFTSVSGSDPAGPLAWLGTDPIRFSVSTVGGVVQGGLVSPCNRGGGPAALDGKTLTFERTRMVRSAMACLSKAAEYEEWTFAFVDEPVRYTYDGTTLTWTNSHGTVMFRR